MKVNFLLLLIQTVLVSSITYNHLRSGVIMKEGDELISTFGYNKLALISNNCSLNLYQFNLISQNYQPTNKKYQGKTNIFCISLTIKNQNVITDNGTVFLSLNSIDLVKVRLFIDDLANLRLIGERNDPFSGTISYYQELKINNFSQSKPLIRILESFQKISDIITNPITNSKNWIFTVNQNQLIIRNLTNEISKSFSLPSAFFSQIGIFDANNQTYPYTNFDGIRYSTVCEEGKNELFGPFIISIDDFWPVMRIYDQDGYILFEYSLSTNSQFYNPCPKGTFSFSDRCDLKCPASYMKQIVNNRGTCKLNCEKGSYLDKTQNTCVCKNRQISAHQRYVCVNSTSYYFGCYCQANLFFDRSTRKCVQNCPNGQISFKGLCLNCSNLCTNCTLKSGFPFLVVCNSCQSGYILINGICVESNTNCISNCLICLQDKCIVCLPFYSLLNNTCIQQCPSTTKLNVLTNLTSFCAQTDSQSCSPACQVCLSTNSSSCMACKPGYYLLLSSLVSSCQTKNLLFSCRSTNYINFNNLICYNNQTNYLSTLTKCVNKIFNCMLCVYQSNDKCIVCNNGFYLQQNKCVSNCSEGYFVVNQACVLGISQCKINGFSQGLLTSNPFDLNIVTNNQVYNYLISNGRQQLNEPYGYQLFATKNYGFANNYNPINSILYWSQITCFQCNNGYGVSKDNKQCLPCPNGCLLCQFSYDGSCIANTTSDVTLYTQGIDIKNCKTFLSEDFKCLASCPHNTFPYLSAVYQQLMCGTKTVSQSQSSYLKIDGTSIKVSPDLYLHRFVFSAQLINNPDIKNRLLQSGGSFDKNGRSFTVQSDKPYYILKLQGELQNYKSFTDTYPANSIYGINIQTSFSSYIKNSLAYIGYILSLLILMTHCIYVGNGFTYKMDNIIIFAQTIFYFLFSDIFISNPVSQYYYGWSWMHINFYPNYFWSLLSADQKTIPPYALYNIDANFIRNAGSSISLLLTFLILWLIISGICYFVQVKLGKWQIWYQRIFKNSLTSMVEFCSFNIFYWAVAYFKYDFNSDSKQDTKESYTGFPVMFIIGIVGYSLIRFYFDIILPIWKHTNQYEISSLYMIKRIVYASVIASSYHNKVYLVILIAFELLFTTLRFFSIQKPNHIKQKLIMWLQAFAIVFATLILYTVTRAFAVAFLITLVVYLWYLTFVIDLVDIYLISKNKVLKNSWFPCLQERISVSSRDSSKDDFNQPKTDRPFNSEVQK